MELARLGASSLSRDGSSKETHLKGAVGSAVGAAIDSDEVKAIALKAVQGVTGIAGEVAMEVADLLRVSAGFAAGAASLVDMVGGVPFIKARAALLTGLLLSAVPCPNVAHIVCLSTVPAPITPIRYKIILWASHSFATDLIRARRRPIRCSLEFWKKPRGSTHCARR